MDKFHRDIIRRDAKKVGVYKVDYEKTMFVRSLVEVVERDVRARMSLPRKIHYFVAAHNAASGGLANRRYTVIVSRWSFDNPQHGRLMWVLYHELTHVAQCYNDGYIANHDKRFYEYFSTICPLEYWKYEQNYMPKPTSKWLITKGGLND